MPDTQTIQKPHKLTRLETNFVQLIVENNKTLEECYLQAGYKPNSKYNRQAAEAILRKCYIVAEIQHQRCEKTTQIEVNKEYAKQEHRKLREICIKAEDYSSATRNLEDECRTEGVYEDRLSMTDTIKQAELTKTAEDEAEERRKFIKLRIDNDLQQKSG
jgi:hypothetical protein